MRLAGFDLLFIGIESFNQNSLIETAKVQNTKLKLVTIIKEIQSYGFTIVAGLIFGFDTDQENAKQVASKFSVKSFEETPPLTAFIAHSNSGYVAPSWSSSVLPSSQSPSVGAAF